MQESVHTAVIGIVLPATSLDRGDLD